MHTQIWWLYFVDFQSAQLKILKAQKPHFSSHSLSGQLSPVWLTQLVWVGSGALDQHSHFDLQPFVWPIVSVKTDRPAASHHRAHAALFLFFFSSSFLCKLSSPCILTAAGQRSTGLFDHVCPPLASWTPFITLQSLNHRCAFERKRERQREKETEREREREGKSSVPSDWLRSVELCC